MEEEHRGYTRFDDWAGLTRRESIERSVEDEEDAFWKNVISYMSAIRYLMEKFGWSPWRARWCVVASRHDGVWRIPVSGRTYFNREAFMKYVDRVKEREAEQKESSRYGKAATVRHVRSPKRQDF